MRDITMAVYEFMVKENIQERLQRTEEEFQKAGELATGEGIFTGLPDHYRII